MSKKYIDVDKLESANDDWAASFYDVCNTDDDLIVGDPSDIFDEIMDIVNNVPATDVQEVKHGKWNLTNEGSMICCSKCGEWFDSEYVYNYKFNYCPCCGAKMGGTK